MGVYIKNMEMPTNCGECLLAKLSPTGESLTCNYMLSRVSWKERPFDCPLVPIPKHGRLIDADALTETTNGIWDCNDLYFQPNDKICDPNDCRGCKWRETMDCFRRMVKHTPTIIPADESDMDSFIHIFEEDDEEDEMDSFIRIFKD